MTEIKGKYNTALFYTDTLENGGERNIHLVFLMIIY